MNAKALILALLLPATVAAQGYAGLGADASGFTPVTPPADFAFPPDHAPHPGFRIEWWYVTANLTGPDGADYGVQWTLFRQALGPGPDKPGWDSPEVWMAHAAATSAKTHRFAQSFARGGIGQAGVALDPFRAWIDDWTLTATDDTLAHLALGASSAGFAYALSLDTAKPLVAQGEDGYSVKSDRGQASYYYSQPFYTVTGTLTLDGAPIPVTGQAWLDREWSSQPLAEGQQGWDWFALHLDSGAQAMVYRMRQTGGAYFAGTWIDPDGTPHPLGPDQITATPGATSEVEGHTLPVVWHLEIPDHGLAVDTRALNAQSWMGTAYSYWEGPIRITGSHSGTGYLEMTGY